MADIFREVDEDLRHERYLKLWRRFRYWFIGAVCVILGAAIAYVVVTNIKDSRRREAADRYASALEELEAGKNQAAADAFEALAANAGSGYAALAQLRAAAALAQGGDTAGAVSLYDQMAGDGRVDKLYRELATLLAANLLVDTASADEINQRLAPLLTGDSPWRPLAAELSGTAALRAGHTKAAREIFKALASDPRAPAGVQARASELLASLGGESSAQGEAEGGAN